MSPKVWASTRIVSATGRSGTASPRPISFPGSSISSGTYRRNGPPHSQEHSEAPAGWLDFPRSGWRSVHGSMGAASRNGNGVTPSRSRRPWSALRGSSRSSADRCRSSDRRPSTAPSDAPRQPAGRGKPGDLVSRTHRRLDIDRRRRGLLRSVCAPASWWRASCATEQRRRDRLPSRQGSTIPYRPSKFCLWVRVSMRCTSRSVQPLRRRAHPSAPMTT
jgi:hypothetical protein